MPITAMMPKLSALSSKENCRPVFNIGNDGLMNIKPFGHIYAALAGRPRRTTANNKHSK